MPSCTFDIWLNYIVIHKKITLKSRNLKQLIYIYNLTLFLRSDIKEWLTWLNRDLNFLMRLQSACQSSLNQRPELVVHACILSYVGGSLK